MLEMKALKDFSVSSWYDTFKHVAIETVLIEISPELLNSLRSGDLTYDINEICSSEYLNRITNTVNSFKDGVFIKNNWHAPTDARSFSFANSLKATNVDEIFLFMFTSDILVDDFNIDAGIEFVFAVRPYMNIHPASEFRCIVVNNVLRGISPRDFLTYYPHLIEDGPNILTQITQFFDQHIQHKFLQKNYTFDILLIHPNGIKLMDFGALNSKANLYAFKWPEIQTLIKKNSSVNVSPVFRYLESDIGIMSNAEATSRFSNSL